MPTNVYQRASDAADVLARHLKLKQGEAEKAGGLIWQDEVVEKDKELDALWSELRDAMSDLGQSCE